MENLIRTTVSNTAGGVVEYWAVSKNRTIRFSPRAAAATTLRVRYKLRPGTLGDADFPAIPLPFAEPLFKHYAAWHLLMEDSGGEELSEANIHLGVYQQMLASLRTAQAGVHGTELQLVEPSAFHDLTDTDGVYGIGF